jgi:hypothetical protein
VKRWARSLRGEPSAVVVPGSDPTGKEKAEIRSGLFHMNVTKRISLWAACEEVGGYPELLSKLATQHGLEIHMKGRARYVNRGDLESLGRYVRDWLNRPRTSRRSKKKCGGACAGRLKS